MTDDLEEFKAKIAKHAAKLRRHKLIDEHGVTGYWLKAGGKKRDYRKREIVINLPDPLHENL